MADFELDHKDLDNNKILTQRIGSHFYPNGQVVIKNTTLSQNPMADRTLRSSDPVAILQGDGIYRNPALVTNAYAQSVQSALHGIIASRADIDDKIQVPDPNDPTGTKFLKGADARNELLKGSVMSTGIAPSGFTETIRAVNNSKLNSLGMADGVGGYVTGENGQLTAHGMAGYQQANQMQAYNSVIRDIAIVANISENEQVIYEQKIKELKSKVNFESTNNFGSIYLDFSKISSYNFTLTQTDTYFGGNSYQDVPVSSEYSKLGQQRVYLAAALIQLLLELTNKIYINGEQGERGFVGANHTTLTAENNSLTDHTFGRAFDIFHIGYKKESAFSFRNLKIDEYKKGLNLLLETIQVLPQDLHPDLIVISDLLAVEYGVNKNGLEPATSMVRKQFPGLSPYINFSSDSNHRDHVHISFSSKRGGSFIKPDIAKVAELQITPGMSEEEKQEILRLRAQYGMFLQLDKFKKVYSPGLEEELTLDEMMSLLQSANIFSDEICAIFVGIARRESRWKPAAINGDRNTGDFSLGLFQVNFLPAAHGSKYFYLQYPNEASVLGYKLAWSTDGETNPSVLANRVKYDANINTVDQRMFIPYNQVIGAAIAQYGYEETLQRVKGKKAKFDEHMFHPWGDYGGGSPVGFIYGVSFSRVLQAYRLTGKSEEILKNWIRQKFVKKRSYPYIEKWMSGVIFTRERKRRKLIFKTFYKRGKTMPINYPKFDKKITDKIDDAKFKAGRNRPGTVMGYDSDKNTAIVIVDERMSNNIRKHIKRCPLPI